MNKTKLSDIIFLVVDYFVMGLFALVCTYPFYYIIINSISDNNLVIASKIQLYPIGIHFTNFINVFKMRGLGQAAFISVARTVVGTLFMLVGTSVMAYAMTRQEYWHRKFWYRFMIITMYFSAGMIPTYLVIKRLGLLNSFWVYVIGAPVSPYNMILVKTYMESIPSSLEEAAIVDGGGYYVRFTRIMLPLSKPILATVAIFTAVSQWNSYMDTILYTSGSNLRTLQSVLYEYMTKSQMLANLIKEGADMSLVTQTLQNTSNVTSARHTVTVVTLLPVLLVYPFFQRYFTKGIMIGAVKG